MPGGMRAVFFPICGDCRLRPRSPAVRYGWNEAEQEGGSLMPTKPLDRLIFAQGGSCFFCGQTLAQSEASVEHLVAVANGGGNAEENCVACCKALNALFGRKSLKEKIQIVLNQKGHFKCPNRTAPQKQASGSKVQAPLPQAPASLGEKLRRIIEDLRKRGTARPSTVRKLSSTIGALFQKQISEEEVSALVERLQAEGFIVVTGAKVSYEL